MAAQWQPEDPRAEAEPAEEQIATSTTTQEQNRPLQVVSAPAAEQSLLSPNCPNVLSETAASAHPVQEDLRGCMAPTLHLRIHILNPK